MDASGELGGGMDMYTRYVVGVGLRGGLFPLIDLCLCILLGRSIGRRTFKRKENSFFSFNPHSLSGQSFAGWAGPANLQGNQPEMLGVQPHCNLPFLLAAGVTEGGKRGSAENAR